MHSSLYMKKEKIRIISLLITAVLIILFLLFLKSAASFTLNPYYTALSLFILFYIGSRIGASFFYKPCKIEGEFEWPPITFIIPSYNEEEAIVQTINHCFEVDYPKHLYEVIVINDGSSDNTWEEILEAKKLHPDLDAINLDSNEGKREAMAAGIRKAKGEIIIQLDSDSYIEKNSLKNLIYPMKNKSMAAVSAHTDPANKDINTLTRIQASYYYVAFRILKAAESATGLVFCCSGCCSAYRKEYIMPLLDEWRNETHFGQKMKYGEDRSLTNLLIKSGYITSYCSSAQAYTIVPTKFRKFIKQQVRWKKSWIVTTHRTARYIAKRDPFVAFAYLFPQMIVSYLAPLLTLYAIFYVPFIIKNPPVTYMFGLVGMYGLFIIYYSYLRADKYRPYLLLWGFLNIFLASLIFPFAFLTLNNNHWGTR